MPENKPIQHSRPDQIARLLGLGLGAAKADRLFELLAPYRNGTCPIVVEYSNHGVAGELELPEGWRVALDEPLLSSLAEWLPPGSVRVIY